ncbi:hypothetical protein BpHYR1_030322 [Brachionus plicatilis]|uniref:Uncharacterized protein n=1 Tax=Brachionus plicatilis TaxID=10195 RepID=A0A3M7RRU2_BRAPC|nr:hypothetical protein BpHYR1_030322 [Brachionus plicatilis]
MSSQYAMIDKLRPFKQAPILRLSTTSSFLANIKCLSIIRNFAKFITKNNILIYNKIIQKSFAKRFLNY